MDNTMTPRLVELVAEFKRRSFVLRQWLSDNEDHKILVQDRLTVRSEADWFDARISELSRLMADEGGLVGAATPSASLEEVGAGKIHAVLSAANIPYSAFSTSGCNIFGDQKSIERAAEAFHALAIEPDLRQRLCDALTSLQANEVKRLSNPVDDGAVERAFDDWFKDFTTWGLSKDELIRCSYAPGNGPGDAVFTSKSGSVMTRSMCERWIAFHSAASAGWNARAALKAAEPHP